jgi:hypothetical protein
VPLLYRQRVQTLQSVTTSLECDLRCFYAAPAVFHDDYGMLGYHRMPSDASPPALWMLQ